MYRPEGKRVLVTGSSAGLGAALARQMAEQGAIVAVCGRREDRLEEVLAELRRTSPASRSYVVDLGDLDGLEGFARRVAEDLGGLDLLVNNAGIPKRRWAWEHRHDEIADVLRVDLESPIRLTLALLDALSAGLDGSGGDVVFVGSVAARLSPPSESVYAAAKAGITAFAECLRVDLAVAGSGIGVHVVQPGVLDTELFDLPDNDTSLADIEALPASAIVAPVLSALSTHTAETFVPEWFADVAATKVGDLDAFLAGSIDYTTARLDALGRARPTPPGRSR